MRVYVILNNYIFFLVSFTLLINFVIVLQLLSRVRLFATPWTAARQTSLSIIISQSLFKFISIEPMMPSNHLILCCPLLLLPSLFPSIKVFSNESSLHVRWPKYWIFSLSLGPSNEYSGLISIKIDWFDFVAVQGTLKSSPAPQFKGFNFLVLSNFYCPALTSVHVISHSRGTSQPCTGKKVLYH